MKRIVASALLALLLPLSASAEVESWYTYWAIGMADHDYPGGLDAAMDAADSVPGIDRTELGYDMFGFYWPYQNNTLLGFVVSGSSDRLEDDYGDYIQINQYLYGLSAMHFFGKEIGDGFYVRGDAGMAKISLDSSFGGDVSSDNGTGFLLGLGYAIPISGQSRILFGVNMSSYSVEGENSTTTTFTIGGLW